MKTNQTKPIGSSVLAVESWSLSSPIHLSSYILVLLLPALLGLPAAVQAQFNCTNNDVTVTNAIFYGGNPIAFRADAWDGKGNATNVDSTLADTAGNRPHPLRLPFTNSASGHQLGPQANAWAVSQFPGKAGNEVSYRLAPPVGTEAGDKPAVSYSPGLELRPMQPINVVQSQAYPGIEYSGSLVQAFRGNPLQLINPFAPAIYGNGEANTVLNPVTKAAEGLKFFQISF